MNAAGPRSAWPPNAIPALGQVPHLTPWQRGGTARLQAPPLPYCRQPMTEVILENPLARPVAAIARPAPAQAARTPPRRARTADRTDSPPPSATARPS